MIWFSYLSEAELSALSEHDFRSYMQSKRAYEWSLKSLDEKDNEVRNGYDFLISRRDIYSLTIEEELEYLLNPKIDENSPISETLGSGFQRSINLYRSFVNEGEKFTFFWHTKSPFSQWHPSEFIATTLLVEGINDLLEIKRSDLLDGLFPLETQKYSSCEQFMMYHKAMIFLDRSIAKQIMDTDDVQKIKQLGRLVKNYDDDVWKYYRSKIVYEGNKAKFEQNKNLRQSLFATQGTTLVEAAPNDSVWGIGVAENDVRALNRSTWQGKNLLGEILTKIRIELTGAY